MPLFHQQGFPDTAESSSVIKRTLSIVVLKHIKNTEMSHAVTLGKIFLYYGWTQAL